MNDTNEVKLTEGQSPMGVPVAIVIAGALIAAAIYFGNSTEVEVAKEAPAGGQRAEQEAQPAREAGNVAGAVVGDIRPVDKSDHVLGEADAKVTVIEYSDIECPFCRRFHPAAAKLVGEFPDDVRWVWRHFPLEQLHPNARMAALATECAGEQGMFWELLDHMMSKETVASDEYTEEKLPAVAQAAGVKNITQFKACLADGKYNQKIESDMADAAKAGGRGTPYSVVIGPNGEKEAISGAQPYENVKAVVEEYL